MKQSRKWSSAIAAIALFLVSATPTSAMILIPTLIPDFGALLTPSVIASSPTDNERIVMDFLHTPSEVVPVISVMFNEKMKAASTPAAAVNVYNDTDGLVVIPASVTITDNMLYIETGGLRVGRSYTVTVRSEQIMSLASGLHPADYIFHFKIDRATLGGGFPPSMSEPSTSLSVEKTTLTPSVSMSGVSSGSAKYRISISNMGGYDLSNVTVKDTLPVGFSFDSMVSGATASVSGTRIVTFTLSGTLARGDTTSFEYRVIIDGSNNSSGERIVPAGTYNNSVWVSGEFTPSGDRVGEFTNPVTTAADQNSENDENVTITRPFVLPTFITPSIPFLPTLFPTVTSSPSLTSTPTVTASPSSTPTVTALPTVAPSTLPFSHPSTDPLTCLRLNGATAMSFSDVNSTEIQAPYVQFLNTTVFTANPELRLSQGYGNGLFGMNNTLTRFELTKMALGANCINYVSSPAPNRFFTDVPQDDSAMSLVIGKAKALGIVQGIGDRFYPNRPVSYGEMVKILIGSGVYFDHGTPTTVLAHTLTGINDEGFRQYAEFSARMNLVNLGSGNSFPQNDSVQRRFMAQAVARYIAWLKNISIL
ncbi:MAG: S-layer homology domain-containing protein [Candidatus Abawacabacteria bacterium]|nr:S-layer homology domain-containing protein [Candidatus Abawacabacteria bacterium]